MTRAETDRTDALLWFAFPVLLLLTIPIGFVSSDGLGNSQSFASGQWRFNPNHLLFEPLGAWWQTHLGSSRESVDTLKWLSALAGALAAALFRLGVAPRLAATRWEANHATAWLALSSAFLRLWISDEVHMIQMPFVTATAWAALRYFEWPSVARALLLGAALGLAALAFVSNLVLGVALGSALAGWHLARREARVGTTAAAAIALGMALTAGPPCSPRGYSRRRPRDFSSGSPTMAEAFTPPESRRPTASPAPSNASAKRRCAPSMAPRARSSI